AALELDVRLSADGVPVLMHDPELDRTTDATGPVRGRSALELATIDAGYRFTADHGATYPFRGERISVPSLRQVVERFPAAFLLIELKAVGGADRARRVLEECAAKDRVILASFLDQALVPFRRAGFLTGASRRGIGRLWARTLVGLPGKPSPDDKVFTVP